MNQFFELVLSGLMLGCIYALIAMGFVVVFKASNVVNFAHASVVMLGAYLVASWHETLGFAGAIVAAMVVSALVAMAIDIVFVRPLHKRGAGEDTLAIMTLAVNVLLGTQLVRSVGTDLLPSGAPWGAETTGILGVQLPTARVFAALIALTLIAAFFFVFTRTNWGIAMRAAAADAEAAALMGIPLRRVSAGAWLVAGALAAVAGAFFVSFPAGGVSNATGILALSVIPVAVLGGLDSPFGALVGGLIVGVAQQLVAGYQDDLAFFGRGLSNVVPYVVLFVVLLWRPTGLFGTRGVARV